MKKSAKIIVIILLVIVILVIGFLVLTYPGQFILSSLFNVLHSSYCGDEFSNQFNQALANKDFNFCLNYNGRINYATNIKGYHYCDTHKGGNNAVIFIGLPQGCLDAMASITLNVDACKLMKDDTYRDICIADIIKKTGDNQYCSLILPQDYQPTFYGKLICVGNYSYIPTQNETIRAV